MDEYWRDVEADPARATFRDECLWMLYRGEDDAPDLGLAPYRLGVAAAVSGVEDVRE